MKIFETSKRLGNNFMSPMLFLTIGSEKTTITKNLNGVSTVLQSFDTVLPIIHEEEVIEESRKFGKIAIKKITTDRGVFEFTGDISFYGKLGSQSVSTHRDFEGNHYVKTSGGLGHHVLGNGEFNPSTEFIDLVKELNSDLINIFNDIL